MVETLKQLDLPIDVEATPNQGILRKHARIIVPTKESGPTWVTLRHKAFAARLDGQKYSNLSAFRTLQGIDVYHDTHYWSIPAGETVGAYARNFKRKR